MSAPPFAAASACTVAAHGVITAPVNSIAALRDAPGDAVRHPIPPRFLRHADEQTVAGLAAVVRAMDEGPLRDACFAEWGVVAAPSYPGRLGGAATFRRYQQGGTAAISPHIIPQNSLHSVSSAISISLGMRGPNFGIGGGPEALAEGLMVAMTLLDGSVLPGLWLVLTQWAPEPVPDGLGSTVTKTTCLAVALGLRSAAAEDAHGLTLRMTASSPGVSSGCKLRVVSPTAGSMFEGGSAEGSVRNAPVPLVELATWLTAGQAGRAAPWSYILPWGGRVEMLEVNSQQRTKAA